ncbi:splicing factor U2af large subunit B-like [Spinacia oleracea]|uniref:Splicing factor U2af large subunit B-like n=1 Tax=Spinacia oleracea TaxID=3562 RepID=A0ABM3RMN9_SPIOL|nr:splicing factor U2af large subunit B-like [Spinacia oleracea]
MFFNMFPLTSGQLPLGTLPIMHVQAMTQQATRHARWVYVGGLPPELMSRLWLSISAMLWPQLEEILQDQMRSVEEASNPMALDGIIFEGAPVKVRRPSDYNPSLAATLGLSQPNPNLNLAAVGLTPGSTGSLEGPDRIFVGIFINICWDMKSRCRWFEILCLVDLALQVFQS